MSTHGASSSALPAGRRVLEKCLVDAAEARCYRDVIFSLRYCCGKEVRRQRGKRCLLKKKKKGNQLEKSHRGSSSTDAVLLFATPVGRQSTHHPLPPAPPRLWERGTQGDLYSPSPCSLLPASAEAQRVPKWHWAAHCVTRPNSVGADAVRAASLSLSQSAGDTCPGP